MLQMLRGQPTLVYLSDLMQKVGAIDATYAKNAEGRTVVSFTLPDGRVKQQTLPRTAKLMDDKKGT